MSPGRKMITADHVNGLRLEKNANVLSAMATDGPANVGGRGIRVFMSDEALRLLLSHMASDPRWSAAFDAVAADREERIAELPFRSRARLAGAMRKAMADRDMANLDKLLQASLRDETLLTASRPDATDEDVERAVDVAQGTRTRTRSGRPEDHAPAPPRAELTMPEPPWCELSEDDAYAWDVSIGGAIAGAGQGVTTELRSPLDGSVRALITPPRGRS